MTVRLFNTIAGLRSYLHDSRQNHQTIGLVPTMGALHQGHESLIRRAVAENEQVVVSIFVNPLQFSPDEDLNRYPRQLEADLRLCEQLGVDVVFAPTPQLMGIGDDTYSAISSQTTVIVPPTAMTSVLCGLTRPGHFVGVATIVVKLLNIVNPDVAYFGEKDAQQLAIIRRFVADLNIPVEICPCPIIREASGLALSSRNQYLSAEEKEQATVLYRSLQAAKQAFTGGENQADVLISLVKQELATVSTLQPQYVELVDPQTLTPLSEIKAAGLLAIACYLGSTRLIDNIILCHRKPIIAIDGPAGAGKSTVTKRVAEALGLLYLDTGAMYRAITWLVMKWGIDVEDQAAIAELVATAHLELNANQVTINDEDVTQAIRTPEVTAKVSIIAAQGAVRKKMVKLQQQYGKTGGIVAEGRDMGIHVFPDAKLKIFLTASPQERAKRRLQDLKNQGETDIDLNQLEAEISKRDYLDSNRKIAPLTKADDAIELNTDGLTIEEVTEKIINLYLES
jgi:pantoate ligase/cytidylate kinase